ncbi:MAG: PadR family transcriptional regulator [Candidatus Aenigmarchaeota archaeon]|nr:PadR family transcriptional regulator [Candidatus Aenigmarchaeota archaeon]
MRGFLSFHILWILKHGEMHGQQIASEIEKRRGFRPKAGTIYPALKDLEGKGLVRKKAEGRKTFYSLTREGRASVAKAQVFFCHAFGDIVQEVLDRKKTA